MFEQREHEYHLQHNILIAKNLVNCSVVKHILTTDYLLAICTAEQILLST